MSEAKTVYTTSALAEQVAGELRGSANLEIVGVNALDDASADQITFIADAAHAERWADAQAGAAVVTNGIEAKGHDPQSRALIFVPQAELAMIEILRLFEPAPPVPDAGVHHTAVVDETAKLGREVRVGPHVSVGPEATVGDGVVLHAGVRIYAGAQIGEGSVLHANAVVRERCRLGRGVILNQNVSIGADGFGYRPAADGKRLMKSPHVGIVILQDDVEIGANSCVDRGKFGATVVGEGTKIDNLCQIAHNCRIGRCCVIAGLTVVGGSVTIGDGTQVGGTVAVAEHVRIGSGVSIGGGSGVMRDIPDGKTYLGTPATDATETLRQWAAIRKLPGWMKRVSGLAGIQQA